MRWPRALGIGLLALTAGCAARVPSCVNGDLTKTADTQALAVLAPWSRNATVCRIGGYIVIGPAGEPNGTLLIATEGQPVVYIGEKVAQVDVFSRQGEQGGVFLTLQDRDGDGLFDYVSYRTRDSDGHLSGDVVDADLDGEPDVKFLPGGKGMLARIEGQWRPLQKQGDRPGVLIDGKWRPVKHEGWRWKLVD